MHDSQSSASPETMTATLSQDDRRALRAVAVSSVRHGLTAGESMEIDSTRYPSPLQELRATFVTLRIGESLRGCIGVLEPRRPLVQDVADNAFAAAFRDRRFSPVAAFEVDQLHYHISVLQPAESMAVESEQDLLVQLRPGVDGLIIEEDVRRATFLPDVWHTISDPRDFLRHLKKKAGWTEDYWSATIRVWRYTTESF